MLGLVVSDFQGLDTHQIVMPTLIVLENQYS